MSSFFQTPIWRLISASRNSNWKYIAFILIPQILATFFEGGTFAFIYLAFSVLDGKTPESLSSLHFLHPSVLGFSFTKMQVFSYYVLLAVLFQVVKGGIGFLATYGNSLFCLHVQKNAQKLVYRQIFRFSFPFVSHYKIGDLSEYAKMPSIFIPNLFGTLNELSISFFMSLGLLGMLCWISPLLTLLTLCLFLLFSFSQKYIIKKVALFSKLLTDSFFELSHQTTQLLQGIRLIHLFCKADYILDKADIVLDDIVNSTRKACFWNGLIPSISEVVNVLLVGTILILGSFLLAWTGDAALSNLLTYIALTYRLSTRLQSVMRSIGTIGFHSGSIARLNDFLLEEDKEFDFCGGCDFPRWETTIEFRNVTLQYPNSKTPALSNLSFFIPKGKTTAVIGLSGAGKSSLLDLILNLYKPTSGEIFVDSVPLNCYSHQSWRRQFGVVSQDTFIFNGTIEENIRFGELKAEDGKLREVAELAGAAEFIDHLPCGYQTQVGERGHNLSGGQRQRLALARALFRNPEILVLDEATSSLDSHSEQRIQKSLEILDKTKTLIIVAHRLSTVSKADQIIVLEQGKVIEQGSHESLLQLNGRYAKLWQLQLGKFAPKSTVAMGSN